MKVDDDRKIVLLAIVGTAPAVLTEAIWALAMRRKVVPDRVVVMTTEEGSAKLRELVLESGVWDELKREIQENGVDIDGKLVFNDKSDKFLMTFLDEKTGKFIADLSTKEANLYAADQMMAQIHNYSKDRAWQIYGLIAGGRKTMTGLFFSCMSLLSRKGDKLFHVIVSEPYTGPGLMPPFFYPQSGVTHVIGASGKKYPSIKADVNLFEVPYVCVGEWAEAKCKVYNKHLSYKNLIESVERSMDDALMPEIEVDFNIGDIKIDGVPARLAPSEFALYLYMGLKGNPKSAQKGLTDLLQFVRGKGGAEALDCCACRWLQKLVDSELFGRFNVTPENRRMESLDKDRYKVLNRLKEKLQKRSKWFLDGVGLRVPEVKRLNCKNNDAISPGILKFIFS